MVIHKYEVTIERAELSSDSYKTYARIYIGHTRLYKTVINNFSRMPSWNGTFMIDNVRDGQKLRVEIWCCQVRKDHLFGSAEFDMESKDISSSGKSMVGELHKKRVIYTANKGRVYLHMRHVSSQERQLGRSPMYAGPPRFEVHNPVATGVIRHTVASTTDLDKYYTNTLYLAYVEDTFHGKMSRFDPEYKAVQKIFASDPRGALLRQLVRQQHRCLFSSNLERDKFDQMHSGQQFLKRIKRFEDKPSFYTYTILDDAMRFTETGVRFFRNFLSKHTLLGKMGYSVYYAGEFFVHHHEGELRMVIDNSSGTYKPDENDLPRLEALFKRNFPDINIEARKADDPRTKAHKKRYGMLEHPEEADSDAEGDPDVEDFNKDGGDDSSHEDQEENSCNQDA